MGKDIDMAAQSPVRLKHKKDAITPRQANEPGAATTSAGLEHELVARLAYSYWEARGFAGGSDEEDWYRAEERLKQRNP